MQIVSNIDDNELKQFLKHLVNDRISNTNASRSSPPATMNLTQLSNWLNISRPTIGKWVNEGMPFVQIDNQKLYMTDSVLNWLKQHEIQI